jgi:hypothetical protein
VVCHFEASNNWTFVFETSINAEAYQELIQQFIALLQVDERNCWFQQDRATAHTAASTMEIVHKFFGENVISKGVWPRSPDLLERLLFVELLERHFIGPIRET